MNYCICARVMGCQSRCSCRLLPNVAMHCYALHDNICDACLFRTRIEKGFPDPMLDRRKGRSIRSKRDGGG